MNINVLLLPSSLLWTQFSNVFVNVEKDAIHSSLNNRQVGQQIHQSEDHRNKAAPALTPVQSTYTVKSAVPDLTQVQFIHPASN